MKHVPLQPVLVLLLSGFACVATAGVTTDHTKIDAVVRTIPMTDKSMGYKNLGERFDNLGLVVLSMDSGAFTKDDVDLDKSLRRGDVDYRFQLSPPNEVLQAICPITASPTFIRRGKQWMPTNRTANFLMNYRCVAP